MKKKLFIALTIFCLAGTAAAVKISLDAPARFPTNI